MIDTNKLPAVIYIATEERVRRGEGITEMRPIELINDGSGKPWAVWANKSGNAQRERHIYSLRDCFDTREEAARHGLQELQDFARYLKRQHAERVAKLASAEEVLLRLLPKNPAPSHNR